MTFMGAIFTSLIYYRHNFATMAKGVERCSNHDIDDDYNQKDDYNNNNIIIIMIIIIIKIIIL